MKCQIRVNGHDCDSEDGSKMYSIIGSLGWVNVVMCEYHRKNMSRRRGKTVVEVKCQPASQSENSTG